MRTNNNNRPLLVRRQDIRRPVYVQRVNRSEKDEIDNALTDLDRARTTKTGIDDEIDMKEKKYYDLGGVTYY